jgi:hypothetical protein
MPLLQRAADSTALVEPHAPMREMLAPLDDGCGAQFQDRAVIHKVSAAERDSIRRGGPVRYAFSVHEKMPGPPSPSCDC